MFDVFSEVNLSTLKRGDTLNIKVDKNRFTLCEGDDFLVYNITPIGDNRLNICLRTYPYGQLSTRVRVKHFEQKPESDYAEVVNEDEICFPDPRQFM